jgi:hypothetical protein
VPVDYSGIVCGCFGSVLLALAVGFVILGIKMTSPEVQERMKHRKPPSTGGAFPVKMKDQEETCG